MTAQTLQRQVAEEAPAPVRPRRRISGTGLMHAYTWILIAWLVLPIAVMIAFGFNDTPGRYNQTWQGFTVKWYGRLLIRWNIVEPDEGAHISGSGQLYGNDLGGLGIESYAIDDKRRSRRQRLIDGRRSHPDVGRGTLRKI